MEVAAAASLSGWRASVYDAYSRPRLADRFTAALQTDSPTVVGLSVHGPPGIAQIPTLCRDIRAALPDSAILLGGNIASVAPQEVLPYLPKGSLLFAGSDLSRLSEALDAAGRMDRSADPTLFSAGPKSLGRFQVVERQIIPKIGYYLRHPYFEYHIATQIGCPFRCFHCGTGQPGLFARTQLRDLSFLAEELEDLGFICKRMGVRSPRLWITDETVTASESHAISVCEVLRGPACQWRWRAQTRADSVSLAILSAMKASGCELVAFGVEIPTERGMKHIGKRESLANAVRAFEWCRSIGLAAEAIVVLGSPEDATELGDVLSGLRRLAPVSVQQYIYHPVPGSPWWHRYGPKEGPLLASWWSNLDFHRMPLACSDARALTVARSFLALHVAEFDSANASSALPRLDKFVCVSCRRELEAELEVEDREAGLRVVNLKARQPAVLLAIGRRRCVALPQAGFGDNLYKSLVRISLSALPWLPPEACPWCSRRSPSNDLAPVALTRITAVQQGNIQQPLI